MDGAQGCPNCRRLEQELSSLRAELAGLRRQVAELQRAGKRQAAPFRRRRRVEEPQPPGRPPGHPPAHRAAPTKIDRILQASVNSCPDCQSPLTEKTVQPQFQTDLPRVQPIVTQFNIHSGWCPSCRKRVQGRHPEQTSDALGAAANQLGPRVLGLATYMKYRLGVPFRKVSDLLGKLAKDFSVAPGTLARAAARLAAKARPTYDGLLRELRSESVVHGDETGWRIGGESAWLWVFSSPRTTIFPIERSRGHEVIEATLGPEFAGTLVCDGLPSYDATEYFTIRCNAHPLRRIVEMLETAGGADRKHLERLKTIWSGALELRKRRGELTERGYLRRATECMNRFFAWLDFHGRRPGPELERLANHLDDHRYGWLLHLYDEELPATNNHAERMLRFAVILRKVGCANKTLRGAATCGVLTSVLTTLEQRGKDVVAFVRRALCCPEPRRILLQTLPSG